ncbi:MAG: hypothetical protein IID32_07670 [Planctomycetes bacterium]|nr:hypothetical protein [Planctomycetota bacterium]
MITASVWVRPSKSILDLTVKSVKKKWKDKRFAAAVNRDIVNQGCQMLDPPLEQIIADTIKAIQPAADSLELRGNLYPAPSLRGATKGSDAAISVV